MRSRDGELCRMRDEQAMVIVVVGFSGVEADLNPCNIYVSSVLWTMFLPSSTGTSHARRAIAVGDGRLVSV